MAVCDVPWQYHICHLAIGVSCRSLYWYRNIPVVCQENRANTELWSRSSMQHGTGYNASPLYLWRGTLSLRSWAKCKWTHPLPLGVLAGWVLPDFHIGITHRIGDGQEDAVCQDDTQDQAIEPWILYSLDCKPPDGVAASKDTEGEIPCLRLHSQRQSWQSRRVVGRHHTHAGYRRHIYWCFKQTTLV